MNEPTQKGQSHVDQHVRDLLNGSIDGELSAAEQTELDALLAGSARVRDLHEELKALSGILDRAPEQELPEYLHDAIISQVRLPVSSGPQGQKPGLFSQWLAAPWMRTGLAMAAGVLLTFGIYQTGTENLSPEDAARMTGTVAKNPGGVLLDSTRFNSQSINGKAEVRSRNGLLFVDVYLESDGMALLNLGFSGQDLEYAGINGLPNSADGVTVSNGQISVTSSGQQHYELLLKSIADVDKGQSGTLTLAVYEESALVHEAELDSSQ